MVHHGNAECDSEIKRYLAYSKKIKITLLSLKERDNFTVIQIETKRKTKLAYIGE